MSNVKEELGKKAQLKRNLEILKNSPGWEDVELYLTARECKLMRMLMKGKLEDLKASRDRLDEIQSFKRYLGVSISDGASALKELELYDDKYGDMV
jgi:hypothetical protein